MASKVIGASHGNFRRSLSHLLYKIAAETTDVEADEAKM